MSERSFAPRSRGRTTQPSTGRTTQPSGRATEPSTGRNTQPSTGRNTGRPGNRSTQRPGSRTQGTAALKLDTAAAEPLRATGAATAPRLRVAPPAPISAPRAPFIALVIALVIAGVIGILLINTETNLNSFEIRKLQDQQAALDTRQQQLENQLATYESVGNLDAAANRLGLVKGVPAFIRLPDGKVIGVPRPGRGEVAVTAQNIGAAARDDAVPGAGR